MEAYRDGEKRSPICSELQESMRRMNELLHLPVNSDFVCRRFRLGERAACLYFLQGMADAVRIDRCILAPCQQSGGNVTARELCERVLQISEWEEAAYYEKAIKGILAGKTCLMADDMPTALLLDTRGYDKRAVDITQNESVVMGPKEGFVESLRTNVTLIRRILPTERLMGEELSVGTRIPTRISLMYLEGVARKETVDRIRRKVQSVEAAQCPGAGFLQQHMEEHPFSLFPQMMQTERPDRAAAMLSEGQILLMVEGSPFALAAPITLFHLLHTAEDAYMRWQNGTFLRIIRMLGAVLALVLPGLYMAVTLHESHMIPTDLLISIAESRSHVPFGVFTEIVIMEISFFLINEAGTRIPSLIGPSIGIVGALILGQAAVSASIISPILIIIVAVTGLGSYCVPYYPLSIALSMLRLALSVVGAWLGLYGLTLALGLLAARLCSLTSFGVPYLSPFTPYRGHNPDLVVRGPIWKQRRFMFMARWRAWTEDAS